MTTTLNRTDPAGAVPKKKDRGGPWLSLLAWVIGILFVLPVAWMVLTSFHSEADAATNPPAVFAPLTLEGYREFFSGGASPWPPLLNSLTASVVSTLLVLLLSFPAAYALSIKPVKKWTDVLFFFLSTKMLPVVAGLLPLYLFAQNTGLLDNIWLLIVFYTSMNLPIAVWMMRSFLSEVPVEMLEAAAMDGATPWAIFRHLTLPHLRQYLELGGLLGAIYIVQNFDAVFTLTAGGLGTANLPYAIYQTFYFANEYGLASAAGVVVVIGTIIVATFALRTVFSLFKKEAAR